ncbi:ABC transporter permease [Thomasclavelia ramosa]|uniref:ABC transporter permease n=4 Tax=Thomasclavelia ramosa TaxID=1547 RepID=UPI000E48B047|nr:ABC transporter permease [Thomasclavelia ramosa]RHB99066.1 ABC transporter permease [Thomasclavelia ramosa]
MYKLIKLILYRIKHNKAFLITYLVLIPIIIALAIYFTNCISHTIQIGIVGDIDTSQNSQIKYTYLDTLPSTSELVLNQYDAVMVQDDKNIDVLSTKGETYNQTITLLVNGQINSLPVNDNQRGSASNILGFLMMVILLLGGQIYKYYFDERTGINKRILSTSVSCYQYLLSHFIVVYIFLFIPATIVICSALFVFKITLSIALWKFILILALLCFFATSFGLWSNVLSKSLEESMMFGNMFAIIGTIVSGGITQVTNNEIFNYVVQFFPQKQVMTTLSALENKSVLPTSGIIYSLLLSLVLIISAIVIEKRKLSVR